MTSTSMEGVQQQRRPYRDDSGDDAVSEELAAVNDRLDELTRHIEQIAHSTIGQRFAAAWPGGPSSERVAEALTRLDRRLDQVIDDGRALSRRERRADDAPPAQPDSETDHKSAEWASQIAVRQRALDGDASSEPEIAAPQHAGSGPDLAGMEQQLRQITHQIDSLQQPYEEGIAALRSDLAGVGRSLSEAMPRRSIEAIETQVRALADRIDEVGVPGQAAGSSIALKQLEEAMASLRSVLSNVASEGSVVQLAAEVRGLASGFERAAVQNDNEAITNLDGRIAKLSEKLDTTDSRIGHLGTLERGMAELLALVEEMRGTPRSLRAGPPAMPVTDATSQESGLESPRGSPVVLRAVPAAAIPKEETAPEAPLQSPVGLIEEPTRDRPMEQAASGPGFPPFPALPLAVSPLDLIPAEPHQATPEFSISPSAPLDSIPAEPGQVISEPLPLLPPSSAALDGIESEPDQAARAASAPPPAPLRSPSAPSAAPAMGAPSAPPGATPTPPAKPNGRPRLEPRRPIDPNLPPDTPIEPGAGVPRIRTGSAAARIAASEAVLCGARPTTEEPGGKSAAITAARNAARAAAQESAGKAKSSASGSLHLFEWFKKARNAQAVAAPPQPGVEIEPAPDVRTEQAQGSGTGILQRLKKALVAASVAIIVVGATQTALDLLSGYWGEPAISSIGPGSIDPVRPPPIADVPSAISPLEVDPDSTAAIEREPSSIAPADAVRPDRPPSNITGSIPASAVSAPVPADTASSAARPPLPATNTRGPAASETKNAALHVGIAAQDPAAEYEMGVRYAEGRGVSQDLQEAARWFERAANADFAPAQFRLAGLNEKGEGTKKDVEAARRLYLSAANKGHAKAMHNLAVIYAEGAGGRPDYKAATQWFRKAATYGIADSQYNLAILYARGIGVEVNLAESYKWFAIASARGDGDAAKKRDEVAARLDPQTLMAAKLAVQTFMPEREPDDAVNLRVPAGGWDRPPAQPAKARPRAAASPAR